MPTLHVIWIMLVGVIGLFADLHAFLAQCLSFVEAPHRREALYQMAAANDRQHRRRTEAFEAMIAAEFSIPR